MLFLLFCGCLLTVAAIASPTLSDLLPHKAFEANITQEQRGSVAIGSLRWAPPNYFIWQIDTPEQQKIINDGKVIWFYDIDFAQISKFNNLDSFKGTPAFLLSSARNQLEQYYYTSQSSDYAFKLTPLTGADEHFSSIEISFTTNGQIASIMLEDQLDQQTIIQFSNWQWKKNLKGKDFSFIPPAGIDVLETE